MSWQDYHRRARLIDAVLREVAATGRAEVPAGRWSQIAAEFGDETQFAGALYYRWFTALTARVDAELENPAGGARDAAAAAAEQLARERPALHALLATYADHPALAGASQPELAYLRSVRGREPVAGPYRVDGPGVAAPEAVRAS